jgi:hypothetical protein
MMQHMTSVSLLCVFSSALHMQGKAYQKNDLTGIILRRK